MLGFQGELRTEKYCVRLFEQSDAAGDVMQITEYRLNPGCLKFCCRGRCPRDAGNFITAAEQIPRDMRA
jgi:hypothetical protein